MQVGPVEEREAAMERQQGARVERAGPWPGALEIAGGGLAGPRVRLERLQAGRHAAALYAGFGAEAESWDYMGYGPFAAEADYAGWVRAVEGGTDPLYLAVLDGSGQARGVLSLLRLDLANGVCEVGNIAWTHLLRRSAAATEALHLLAGRVFALGYRRFEWKCDARNLPSRRAAQRLGFSFEGVFRQHMVVKGRNRDTAWFAMTDGDWARIGPAQARWLAAENFDGAGRQRQPLSALTRPLLAATDPALG